jgi:bifunctional UDP-N-acetylglucosamine pyrophosphorylase/glucosamine-1-phosphate N-acetyltransferase
MFTSAIVLAAGQGTRMKSARPKVLHAIAGRPLLHYPVQAALAAGCDEVVVVVGHGRELVEAYLAKAFGKSVRTAVQHEQRGTGDAARAGLDAMNAEATHAVVFYGDVPLLEGEDIAKVLAAAREGASAKDTAKGAKSTLALATIAVDDPTGYGRVLRDAQGNVVEIREHKDLRTEAERAVREINPGIYASDAAWLREVVRTLEPNNAQKELYLTDIVALARKAGRDVTSVSSRSEVLLGVNDRVQLVEAERRMHARIADHWRREGVTVREGARVDHGITIGRDTVIESGAVLRGETRVGADVLIDVGCVLSDAVVEDGAAIKPYSVLGQSTVGPRAQVGPFSHLRPESHIGEEAHVGNFVETKKTTMGKGSKANHLAYLGDGVIGERANIGAGTIFCNYDGFKKHTTTIEDEVFVGSDSQLVAPLTLGKGAYVATGTTVTKDVPAGALAISRVKQENKEGYAARLKARLKAAKG